VPVLQQTQAGAVGTAAYPGLLVYAGDIIKAALRSIGAYEPGEQPTAAEMNDALYTLNQMMDAWQAQRLLVFSIQRYVYTPATLKQVYTVGPGGDISIPRPANISSIGVINQPGSSEPIELPLDMINEQEWRDIPVKNTAGALPLRVWDDCDFPLRNLSFWPIPNVSVSFALYIWQLLSQFADVAATLYAFPPAYLAAIRYSLAIELAAEFPGDPEQLPIVTRLAEQYIDVIKMLNQPSMKMACDPALVNPKQDLYNWLTDQPAGR
jgi:hypothetical protein